MGEKKQEHTRIRIIHFKENDFQEIEFQDIESCFTFKDKPGVTWINIDGLHNTGVIEQICNHYDIHALVQEDIVHSGQRPKREYYDSYYYFVIKMLTFRDQSDDVLEEQISLVLGPNYVITFQEQNGDLFDPVRERVRIEGSRIRNRKSDYIAYALIDTVVDHYFYILERLDDKLIKLDEDLFENPSKETLHGIYDVKRKIIEIKKSIWPLREIIGSIQREESPIIHPLTHVYFKDLQDHIIQVVDILDSFREIVGGMLDAYMTNVSNKMNEVMKVLTIIATIFIPITFVAGIYGMNFKLMPELEWRYGYFAVWGIILLITFGMLLFFRKKKWL